MPRRNKIEAYRTVNANTEIRIYETELRKLLGLPARKGTIVSAEFKAHRLEIQFTSVRGGQFTI